MISISLPINTLHFKTPFKLSLHSQTPFLFFFTQTTANQEMGFSCNGVGLILVSFLMVVASAAGNFYQNFDLTWGGQRAKIFNGGQLLSLSLDKVSGSGFQSKREYLFGRIDMQLKLVAGDSAGTVTAYYVCLHTIPISKRYSILFYSIYLPLVYFFLLVWLVLILSQSVHES